MAPSSILWQNDRKTVVLLDLPRSIEEAQVPSSQLTAGNGEAPIKLRRLVSALPPACPFPTPEPRKAGGSEPPTASPSAQVAELMTQAAVESALEEIKASSYDGPWCLPRILTNPTQPQKPPPTSSRATPPAAAAAATDNNPPHNNNHHPSPSNPPLPSPLDYHLPPNAHPIPATIPPTSPTTQQPCPLTTATPPHFFHLLLLDPPWPNRSAKRKRTGAGAYTPAPNTTAIRTLLNNIPVATRLAPGGLVGVWVTNAGRFASLLTGPRGVMEAGWGVDVVGEWTWLKVTSKGEMVVGVDSVWRRPWERLVIGRRRGGDGSGNGGGNGGGNVGGMGSGMGSGSGAVAGKVIVAVPDVHSRKPNLRGLFEELLPERYEALEVFARNLTAGWWAWGDEVLLFQKRECWVEAGEGEGGGEESDGEGEGVADGEGAGT